MVAAGSGIEVHGDVPQPNAGAVANDATKGLSLEAFKPPTLAAPADSASSAKAAAAPGDTAGVASTSLGRVGQASLEALNPVNLAAGVGNAIVSDYENPLNVAEMLGSSALMGAGLKAVLPEGGPAGLIAGAAIGGYFLYQSLKPMGQAVEQAAQAKTMTDIHGAAQGMDNAAGSFVVNSAISVGGYDLGAKAADMALHTDALSGFVSARDSFWGGVNSKLSGLLPGASESAAVAGEGLVAKKVDAGNDLVSLNPSQADSHVGALSERAEGVASPQIAEMGAAAEKGPINEVMIPLIGDEGYVHSDAASPLSALKAVDDEPMTAHAATEGGSLLDRAAAGTEGVGAVARFDQGSSPLDLLEDKTTGGKVHIKDVTESRSRLSDNLDDNDLPKYAREGIQSNMKVFENRSVKDHLPLSEVKGTYDQVNRLLESNGDTPITPAAKVEVANQIMELAARPTHTDQGYHSTCGPTSLESRLFTKNPSSISQMIADIATTGEYTAKDGTEVKLNANDFKTDKESKSFRTDDGDRKYASKLFQEGAMNLIFEQHNRRFVEVPHKASPDLEKLVNMKTGKPHPFTGTTLDGLSDIETMITGKRDDAHYLINWAGYGRLPETMDEKFNIFRNQNEFDKALTDAKKQGELPLTMWVDTAQPPFNQDGGGGHFISITDYNPKTQMVNYDNQWGSKYDHTDKNNGVSLLQMFHASHPPRK